MWHEAKKQEKKIREVMVDFQRRAERRREHYDKLVNISRHDYNRPAVNEQFRQRADPTTYLRVIGTKCSLHLDQTKGDLDSSMSVSICCVLFSL